MHRPYLFLLALVTGVLIPNAACANTGEQSTSVAGLLVVALILLFAAVCFFLALKIFSLLKGGELASAWQIMAISFMILLLAEAMKLIDMLNVADLGDTVLTTVRLAGIAAVMIGVSKIRNVLS